MSDMLVEIFCEEIPPLLQRKAALDFEGLFSEILREKGLPFHRLSADVTPRRLVLMGEGIAPESEGRVEERRGPRRDAPEKAILGFLGALGVAREACRVVEDKKGAYYVADIVHPPRLAVDILAEAIGESIVRLTWPKSMVWGREKLRWTRPIRKILALLDGDIIPFSLAGLKAGRTTFGHRFLSQGPLEISDPTSYGETLLGARVVRSLDERMALISKQCQRLSQERGVIFLDDPLLVEENAGLTEWPVVLVGGFRETFLSLPEDVLITSLKRHQRCFTLRKPEGGLSASYLLVSNLEARDGGKTIVEGHDRVVEARLCDAAFFWEQDCGQSFPVWSEKLEKMMFHKGLGTQGDRVRRLSFLAGRLAKGCGAEEEACAQAGLLSKGDLASAMVGEFPELQGVMGGHYARALGMGALIADGLCEHYLPEGPSDSIPVSPVGRALSLADKLDRLVGFWGIGEKPSGSRDPYGLRRAALGVIRTVAEGERPFSLRWLLEESQKTWQTVCPDCRLTEDLESLETFLKDRLEQYAKDLGFLGRAHRVVFAPMARAESLPFLLALSRGLSTFLETPEGERFLEILRRALSILRIEETKDQCLYGGEIEEDDLEVDAERTLYAALARVEPLVRQALEKHEFSEAFSLFLRLYPDIDNFFKDVMVNSPDLKVRKNRLALLGNFRKIAFFFGYF